MILLKPIKSLEDSGVLIDRVTETVKHEIEKQEGGILGALSFVTSSILGGQLKELLQYSSISI